jgi:hypothetical protein
MHSFPRDLLLNGSLKTNQCKWIASTHPVMKAALAQSEDKATTSIRARVENRAKADSRASVAVACIACRSRHLKCDVMFIGSF